ncbi:MAG TPA: antitoxin VapB family protein, partial [Candidatus Thermoplasmatota archaeon]|nr:antitoxin VapB family protein [Candidatus Thermoplasmatota archaeon]
PQVPPMPVRTLTVTEDAYARLAAEKRPGESFTDVLLRLTARRSLEDLAAALSPREVNGIAEAWLQMSREGRP